MLNPPQSPFEKGGGQHASVPVGGKAVSRLKPLAIIFLSCVIFSLSLFSLSQLDYQAILFVRSLHNPIIAQLGNIGNRLGHGGTLILVSIALFLVGYVWKKDIFRQVGIDTFVAHMAAGIAVQIPKHVIGRPRPRWTHQNAFEYGPTFQSGLDTFPSGHTTASFAVMRSWPHSIECCTASLSEDCAAECAFSISLASVERFVLSLGSTALLMRVGWLWAMR